MGHFGGIRGAQRALDGVGVKVSRGFLDGQLRGQAKKISAASAAKLERAMAALPKQQRQDIRDDRRRIVAATGNEPRRIAAEAKRAAKRDEQQRRDEVRRFRRERREEQQRDKRRRQPELPPDVGSGAGGGGGGQESYPEDVLEGYDEWMLNEQDDLSDSGWEPPEDLPF